MFSSYGGDDPAKLVLVQRGQDSYLGARDISGFSSRFGRAIGTPLEVRQETQCPFPVATGILGFLSIFQKRQPSSWSTELGMPLELSKRCEASC